MSDEAGQHAHTRTSRLGFWVGLAVLFGGLSLGAPQSMHVAARTHFAEQIPREVAARIAARDATPNGSQPSDPGAAPDLGAIEEQVVRAHAESMMAAAAVTAVVAVWWMTVAVPIPITSLMPLLLLPMVGVLPVARVAPCYANPSIFLFMGGFILALAVQRWNLHRRIALHIVQRVGTSESALVLGFMVASAGLSMWISNTATTMMLLPIGLAVAGAAPGDSSGPGRFQTALMLGIAYAASIGGLATPIGTPANIAFRGQLTRLFPEAPEITFGEWTLLAMPLVIVFLPIAWWVLTRVTCPLRGGRLGIERGIIDARLRDLGPLEGPERTVGILFASTAVLWITRQVRFGEVDYGWAALVERALVAGRAGSVFRAGYIDDASVALLITLLLFIIPAGRRTAGGHREFLMDWTTARRLPWGILLLFGGGFAIAEGFRTSGLSLWCGQIFAGQDFGGAVAVVLGTCLLMTFLTEITSNTATSQVMLPILAHVAVALRVHPLLVMLPATFSASCAFMLPVATPPNAIVFGSGHVRMKDMVRSGLILNGIGAILITLLMFLCIGPVLGLDGTALPAWAG